VPEQLSFDSNSYFEKKQGKSREENGHQKQDCENAAVTKMVIPMGKSLL
jgi:hypothetical protein